MNTPKSFKTLSVDQRVPLLYLLFGGGWILLSDSLLLLIVRDLDQLTSLQTSKGWGFVILSALLIHWLLRRYLQRTHAAEAALRASNAQLHALTLRLTELEGDERRALARELHDRVGQTLTALNINLNIVQSQVAAGTWDKISPRLTDSTRLVDETVECVRDVMANLYPPVLADYGLAAALRWYGERFAQRTEIAVAFVWPQRTEQRFAPHLESVLFRVCQEALNNVARHAQAQHVTIELVLEPQPKVTVRDDGRGFDLQAVLTQPTSDHWGLRTMRERLAAIGGQLSIESQHGTGTTVCAQVHAAVSSHGNHDFVGR